MPQRLRVFISSPGDVPDERLRADLVVDKVAQDFSRFFTFETYRWEHEPMLASGHFQDAIDPPSKADIVILILWSRLGTPLPERTETREYRGLDGHAPVTGTEWEYEDALKAARERGAPDILAFRNVSPASIDTRDPVARERSLKQLDALDAFWKRHFADRGVFLAAYDEYQTLDEFARRLEESLRKLIERRIAALQDAQAQAPIWPDDPFRGLESYEFEHAAIFFGRDGLVAKAAEQLAAGARAGAAFLLLSGPSGSGKSSLVKAALVPRLTKPQRIQGAAFMRRTVFRPGAAGGDVILGLVNALVRSSQEGVGLPEMLAPGQQAEKLAAHLRAAVDEPGFVFAGALGHLTQAARQDGRLLAFEEAKLILVIDQLEELFTTAAISLADRQLFIRLIGNLARSGAVWVIATLRADFWHRATEIPELVALAQGNGRLDVSPPSPAELAEMIRKPAQAAGLGFEAHGESGLGLDVVLAEHAADEPGVLPLLSFTLDALYAKDIVKDGGRLLTFATYESLGGLEGAIATRADQIVAALPDAAQAALPRVLRTMATISSTTDQTIVARAAPLANFPEGGAARQVVDAMTAGRLLVAAEENGAATVRLAHEALISHWRRARDQLVADGRDLQTRALIERDYARWAAARGRTRQQLLLRDPDLANAVDLSARWGDELDAATRTYITASRRRARLRQQLTAAAAVLFALVAVAAVYGGYRAKQERARAELNYAAAKQAVLHLISDVAIGLSNVQGVRVEALTRVLDAVKKTIADLTAENPTDVDLQSKNALMLREFATTYQRAGDLAKARTSAEESLALYRKIAAENPKNRDFEYSVSESLNRMAYIRWLSGDRAGANTAAKEGLLIRRELVKADPTNTGWQGALASNLGMIGSVLAPDDPKGALAAFQESLAIHQKLAAAEPKNAAWQNFAAFDLRSISDLHLAAGDRASALAADEASLAVHRQLSADDPANTDRQSDIAYDLTRSGRLRSVGGDHAGALAAYTESLSIWRQLTASDPGNAAWQARLGQALSNVAGERLKRGDEAGAVAAYEESLAISRKLAATDPADVHKQQDLGFALDQIGTIRNGRNDPAGALRAYEESLAIHRKIAAADPSNLAKQGDVAEDLSLIAPIRMQQGDPASALANYEESLGIVRRLLDSNPNDTQELMETSGVLSMIGLIHVSQGDGAAALAAFEESQKIARKVTEVNPADVMARNGLVFSLDQIGGIRKAMGDRAGALTTFKEELSIAQKLAAVNAGAPFWVDSAAGALAEIGNLYGELGEQLPARQALEQSLEIRRKLVKDNPADSQLQADLAATLHDLGVLRTDTGDPEAALPALEEALAVRRELAAASPGAANPRYVVGLTLIELANAKLKTADLAGALGAYQEAQAILKRLLAAQTQGVVNAINIAKWQRSADIALIGVGDVKLAQDDRDGARAAYGESVASVRKELAADPGNVLLQTDLALGLQKLGAASDEGAARAALSEAAAVLNPLARDGKLTPVQQGWIKTIQDKLATLN